MEPLDRQSDGEFCSCPAAGFDTACPYARMGLGHVKECPVNFQPCPCLPGSTSHAHCSADARKMPEIGSL